MQHLSALLALLLVAVVSAAPSQPVDQQSPSVPVVGNSPAQAPVSGAVPVSSIEAPQPSVDQSVGIHHHQSHHSQAPPSYHAPAGVIQVVSGEQQVGGPKPVASPAVRSVEQYGQPESASLPANYKPFGSWGLYIGGNPADGYYTNYYKALSNSVDQQQQSGEPVKPTTALSPILRQASSSPYVGGDYYPFAYSPSELNSGARFAVEPVHSPVSPVQAGAQVYGAPVSFDSSYHYANQVSPYADSYATKKVGSSFTQQKEVQVPAAPAKGYKSLVYVYPPVGPLSAPIQPSQVHNQHQVSTQSHQTHYVQGQQAPVVAYPVPVGSQIVGSQQGVDGAFSPYGVHAFTRYAVKPTVVHQDASYYYGTQGAQQLPAYKQHVAHSPVPVSHAGYYPFGFYGYPLNQLHYSQGSIVPQGAGYPEFQPQAAPGYPFESEHKVDVEENKPATKPQK